MAERRAGAVPATIRQLRKISPLTVKMLVAVALMTLPTNLYIWYITSSITTLGLLFSSIAGLGFYLTSDRLRDESKTTSERDFDAISDFQRGLVIFTNVFYLNVVVGFGALLGTYTGSLTLALAGFVSFLYPAFDYWLGHKRWWLSPAVLIAGAPAYLPYLIGEVRSRVASYLSLAESLRERGKNITSYIDPEAFYFDLLEVDRPENLSK